MIPEHPKAIGPYEVIEVLGEGGVGNVYLVQQREPFRRKLALKLLKLGMDTREVLVRFAQERQLLASMNHANIARVFDAGQTETGRPYFVMEHVPGEPITDYCEHQRLGLVERLELFVTVCRAIQHAHQRGILHRDVKPSNILVSSQDGRHVPMVIDFGIAKVLRTEPASANLLTLEGQFLGTPRYVSPEQIELSSDEIDARADVYSLGVLLYELIVGEPPHERRMRDAGFSEVLRSIRAEVVVRPSQRLARPRARAEEVAARRGTDRAALAAAVRGDLDWIVVKALEHQRERRYSSAAELASDIEHYLGGEPISARPHSASYRVERFVRRNPLAVVSLLAFVLALALGSGLSAFWYFRANQAREPKAALIAMCDGIRADVADAHLWFEEAVANDETLNVETDVLVPMRRSADRVLATLEGTGPGHRAVSSSSNVSEELRALCTDLDRLITTTQRRWEEKNTAGRIGGELDQEYDALYKRILTRCFELVTDLQDSSARDWQHAGQAALAVNLAAVLFLVLASAAALRIWMRQN